MVPFLASDFARICLCLHPQNLLISTEIGKPISITAHACLQPSDWIGQAKSLMSSFPGFYITSEGCITLRSLGRIRRQPAWKPPCFGTFSGEETRWPQEAGGEMAAKLKPLPVTGRVIHCLHRAKRWIRVPVAEFSRECPRVGQEAGKQKHGLENTFETSD